MRWLGICLAVCTTVCRAEVDTEWVAGWKAGASLNVARAGTAAVASDGFIYVIGGVDGKRFLQTVEYAPVLGDGSLGPWRYTSPLPGPRGFSDAVVRNGYVYVIGGGNGAFGKNLLRSAVRAAVLPQGGLGPWEVEPNQMLLPRRCSKLVTATNRVFSFGGFGGALFDSVESAAIGEDGRIGEWRMEPRTMTLPRYVNGVKRVYNAVYVLGGHHPQQGTGLAAVEWSSLDNPAGLTWRSTSPLVTGRYALATAAAGAWLYVLGGISGTEYLASIEKSHVSAEGPLNPWQQTTALELPLASFSAVSYQNHIYVIGGTSREGYRAVTTFASVNEQGDIGFRASHEQAVQYRREIKRTATPELPNNGLVLDTIQTADYTYIQVSAAAGTLWLAAPKIELAPHTRIRYSQGVYMSNFYSKALQRRFARILFVGTVKPVGSGRRE